MFTINIKINKNDNNTHVPMRNISQTQILNYFD